MRILKILLGVAYFLGSEFLTIILIKKLGKKLEKKGTILAPLMYLFITVTSSFAIFVLWLSFRW